MLTEKQIKDLQEPFKLNEHGFYLKAPYILKSAIRERLNRVSPDWQLLPPELVTIEGDVVVMRGGIQIGDVKRYAIGTGVILRADKDGLMFDGAKLAGMVAKAMKQAASDILPRSAIDFGMGQYLKNKPKKVNEENFAPWLASLTTAPADPNAWTVDNIRAWGDKWRSTGLTDEQLMKALNISDRWTAFKGTVADADKAVDAYRALHSSFGSMQPAQPKAAAPTVATPLPSIDTRIICPMTLIEEGDVILQESKSQTQGTARTFLQVVKYYGKIATQYKLDLKNLATDKTESVHWSGGDQTLVDGPKVKRYLQDPSVCRRTPAGAVWDSQPARV